MIPHYNSSLIVCDGGKKALSYNVVQYDRITINANKTLLPEHFSDTTLTLITLYRCCSAGMLDLDRIILFTCSCYCVHSHLTLKNKTI